jgi:cytochrome c peroxidase
MAIGVDNNDVVGPSRHGPRNQRRAPLVANTIFYPALMWTPRFVALSGDPFDPSRGFKFPPPEHVVTGEPTLLAAQGSLPPPSRHGLSKCRISYPPFLRHETPSMSK